MKSGDLRYSIEVWRSTIVKDQYGKGKTEWEYLYKTRANAICSPIARTEENTEIFFPHNMEFVIRSYHDIKDMDRIYFQGNKYRILSIFHDRMKNQISIKTELINE